MTENCTIKSCLCNVVMSPAIVLYNLVQYILQDWSVCHVSKKTKQIGVGKSIFTPSFLEKENQWLMVDILNE